MHAQMNALFERAFTDMDVLRSFRDIDHGWDAVTRSPTLDMREHGDAYVVILTLSGLDEERLAVTLRDRLLNILAPFLREADRRPQGTRFFDRTVQIPGPVDFDKRPRCAVSNGFLRVVLPKGSPAKTSGRMVRLL